MNLKDLHDLGFIGGLTVGTLRQDMSNVPDIPAVYALVRRSTLPPVYLPQNTGPVGHRGDPTVALDVLDSNWVDGAEVVYIGKASLRRAGTALRKRLREYIRFGEGRANNHWGGRLVWQLGDAADLVVYWKPHPDPRKYETELLGEFRRRIGDRRPFANLSD